MKNYILRASGIIKFFLLMLMVSINADLSAQNTQPQATLSVQGVLTRSDGTAVDDGQYPVTFRLFNDKTGGTMVHSEPVTVETIGGVYSVVLGKQPAFPINAPFDTTYYLSVLIGSTELLPRPQLTHAPYALSILGQSNRFTSTGPILGDAFRVKGGPAVGGLGSNANGFSFQSATGDQSGGMFSDGSNNIELWAGAAKRVKLNTVQNEMYGNLVNFGTLTSNAQTINGDQNVNGFSTIANGQTVNGVQTVNSNQFINGFSTVSANLTVNAIIKSGEGIVNKTYTNSGIFWGSGNKDINLNVNGEGRVLIGDNGTNYYRGSQVLDLAAGDLFILSPKAKGTGGNWKTLQVNLNDGNVRYDNSSRRFKSNIRPLVDDFSLILKAQPRVYNRLDNDTTYNELGYIAEEMDSIGLHKLVQHDQSGVIDGFDYDKMILYTVEVLKIQDAAISQLKAELAALKAENSNLQKENSTLRTDNGALQQQQASFGNQLELLTKRMNLLENTGAEHNRK